MKFISRTRTFLPLQAIRSYDEFMAQEGLYFVSNCITNDDVPFVVTI
jgi:hypothetical protein